MELDYGKHIFEHPLTHRLIGVTPAGRFHITVCDLNADHLIQERRDRAEIWDCLEKIPVSVKPHAAFPDEQCELLRKQAERMIPRIPYIPKDHPAYREELDVLAALQNSFSQA